MKGQKQVQQIGEYKSEERPRVERLETIALDDIKNYKARIGP
jgi:hypothetical protein